MPDRVALGLFWVSTWLNVAMVKLAIGPLPVRSLFLLLSAAALFLAYPGLLGEALRRGRVVLGVIGAVALLGATASLLAASPLTEWTRQIAEVHIQSAINFVVAVALMLRFGVAPVLYAYLFVYALSFVVAVAQFLQLDLGWSIRATLGAIQHDPPETQQWYLKRERATGISFTPVHFATQSCLAIVALSYLRWGQQARRLAMLDPVIIAGALVIAIGCIATGNRSPLIGIALFLFIYSCLMKPRLVAPMLPLAFLAGLGAVQLSSMVENSGIRVARSDSSSENRGTLRSYGLFLIWQQPWGYGMKFDSTEHWQSYMSQARYRPNPLSIRQWALHNYYLNMIARYGVFILLLPLVLIPRDRRHLMLLMPFAAYAVHIFYHNDGPLMADFLIFAILPAAWIVAAPAIKPPVKKWKSAFDLSDMPAGVVR